MNAQATGGLRERKRRQTRERITNAALTLFLKNGFDNTTVEEIALVADISKRSFFDYFTNKEDVIVAWQDEFGDALAAAVAARPANEPAIRTVEMALLKAIADAANPEAIALGQLIRSTPVLHAREQLKYAKLEQTLADALGRRVESDADRVRMRLLSMIVIGGLRIGCELWGDQAMTDAPNDFAKQFFDVIWAELREFAHAARRRKGSKRA